MSGGGKLEALLRNIAARTGGSRTVRVGFLEGSTESDGTSMPMVAAIQEFGAPKAGIPPRPFMRTTVAKHKGEWAGQLAKVLVAQDYDAATALGQMGMLIGGEIQQSIADLTSPALSPVTLMLRKMRAADPSLKVTRKTVGEAAARVKAGETTSGVSTKPLIDHGTMFQGVHHEVVDE
jgi:hypothetical protein